jgi:lipopolysaccharide export system permease protein
MPLAFAVVGVPLALRKRQGGRALSFLLSLACYLGYYLLARISISLGDKGVIGPLWAGQLPNLLAIAFGLTWLKLVERRGP